ncbi:hypothetical protein MASR2M78_14210 [Treponema sp.]
MPNIEKNLLVDKELLLLQKRLQSIFEGNAAGIFVVDENRDIIMVNQRFCDIVGFSKEELVGQNACFAHISLETCMAFKDTFLKAKNEGHAKIEYFVRKKGCAGVWVEMFGSPIELEENRNGVIWSILDISERKAAEETIKNLAFYDALTGLVNRRLLEDRLSMMIQANQREIQHGSVFFLDLDNFKSLNDTHGHHAGDIFLKEVAARLLASARAIDTVARIGGDEFVIIINGLNQLKKKAKLEAQTIGEKIIESLSAPCIIKIEDDSSPHMIEHHSSASIGLTLFGNEDKSSDALIRRADKAMYQAKKSGKNCIKYL